MRMYHTTLMSARSPSIVPDKAIKTLISNLKMSTFCHPVKLASFHPYLTNVSASLIPMMSEMGETSNLAARRGKTDLETCQRLMKLFDFMFLWLLNLK